MLRTILPGGKKAFCIKQVINGNFNRKKSLNSQFGHDKQSNCFIWTRDIVIGPFISQLVQNPNLNRAGQFDSLGLMADT